MGRTGSVSWSPVMTVMTVVNMVCCLQRNHRCLTGDGEYQVFNQKVVTTSRLRGLRHFLEPVGALASARACMILTCLLEYGPLVFSLEPFFSVRVLGC